MAMAMAMATAIAIKPPPIAGDSLRGHNLHCGRSLLFRASRHKSLPRTRLPISPPFALPEPSAAHKEEEGEDSSYSVVMALRSQHNDIVVVDTAKARYLLLDSTSNIHSMLDKEQKWTGSYWDDFATLPAIVPQGPIAILGLGGGTAAHLMLELWPLLHIEGWEIDEILINMAREYFGLSELERGTQAGGSLSVHIGDALSPSAIVEGGFAGIIVDLFSDGKILTKLQEDATWLEIEKKLMPHGRIMVNCGGAHTEVPGSGDTTENSIPLTGSWIQNSTIKALCRAFPGKLSWKRMSEKDSDNYLALTGPLPSLDAWSDALPDPLSLNVKHWKPCELA